MTRDDKLNGLEHYERYLAAHEFHSNLEPAAPMTTNKKGRLMAFDDLGKGLAAVCNPMTRDKTTNPGAPMSEERLAELAPHLTDEELSRLRDFDALRAELTAARTVTDGEVASTIEELNYYTPGMLAPRSLMKQAADLLTRLSAAKAEAERLLQVERGAMDLQANLLKGAEAKADRAERERDEARHELDVAREAGFVAVSVIREQIK